ncbi:MAG TPA: DUF1295 domain-containing protein [Lacunisphaera sp.]|nr:DUF1295 domain-containing protein [Lacunisphaera sp.]
MTIVTILLWTTAALLAGFALLFLWARRINNFGVVDVAWSAAFAVVTLGYAAAGGAPLSRRVALAVIAAAWSLRLAIHLGRRVAAHHPREDARYAQLRRDWAGRLDLKMGAFFALQALSVVLLSWPLLAIAHNPAPRWSAPEFAGALLVLVALAGEALADRQLAAFKRRQPGPGGICAEGLWRYSRHPNYFFEWLVWLGFALWAWPAPGGPAGIASPAVMLYLLLRVTGVRATEDQLARTRGEAFRRYREATPAFVPWFPRQPAARPAADSPPLP